MLLSTYQHTHKKTYKYKSTHVITQENGPNNYTHQKMQDSLNDIHHSVPQNGDRYYTDSSRDNNHTLKTIFSKTSLGNILNKTNYINSNNNQSINI